jgi:hypothetical protein
VGPDALTEWAEARPLGTLYLVLGASAAAVLSELGVGTIWFLRRRRT